MSWGQDNYSNCTQPSLVAWGMSEYCWGWGSDVWLTLPMSFGVKPKKPIVPTIPFDDSWLSKQSLTMRTPARSKTFGTPTTGFHRMIPRRWWAVLFVMLCLVITRIYWGGPVMRSASQAEIMEQLKKERLNSELERSVDPKTSVITTDMRKVNEDTGKATQNHEKVVNKETEPSPTSVKRKPVEWMVYVMSLPTKYNKECMERVASSEDLTEGGVGRRLDDSDDNRLRHTSHFALEVIFHERLLKSRLLTDDLDLADAVYVPYYAGLVASHAECRPGQTAVQAEKDILEQITQSTAWTKLGAKRHFMALGKTENFFLQGEACSQDLDQSSKERSSLRCFKELKEMTFIVPEPANILLSIRLPVLAMKPIVAPYPSWVHFEQGNTSPLPFGKDSARNILVAAAFDVNVQDSYNNQLRRQLRTQLEAKNPEVTSIFFAVKDDLLHNLDWEVQLLEVMRHATFFIHPPGDSTINLKYFFDSILVGCIPVVMMSSDDEVKEALPFSDVIDFSKVVVRISTKSIMSGEIDIRKHLAQMAKNMKLISQFRDYQKEISHVLQYSLKSDTAGAGDSEDAFDITMKKVKSTLGKTSA